MNPDFEYVYVNEDGTIRELSGNEREYLSQKFDPCDSGRPRIKSSYEELDGWDSLSGFLHRSMAPSHIEIQPVNPKYDSLCSENAGDYAEYLAESCRVTGDIMKENRDGSIKIIPNPKLSAEERFHRLQQFDLRRQLERERRAKFPKNE